MRQPASQHLALSRRRRLRGPARGASLIEVAIVLLLFSVGLIGLVALQARAVQFSVSAEDSGRAALLANEIASVMWARNTVTLPSPVITAWNTRVGDPTAGGLPNGVGSVTVAGNVARVTVTWRPPKAPPDEVNRFVTDVVIAEP